MFDPSIIIFGTKWLLFRLWSFYTSILGYICRVHKCGGCWWFSPVFVCIAAAPSSAVCLQVSTFAGSERRLYAGASTVSGILWMVTHSSTIFCTKSAAVLLLQVTSLSRLVVAGSPAPISFPPYYFKLPPSYNGWWLPVPSPAPISLPSYY